MNINESAIKYIPENYCTPQEVEITKDPEVPDLVTTLAREVLDSLPVDFPPCPRTIHFRVSTDITIGFAASPDSYSTGKGIVAIPHNLYLYKDINNIPKTVSGLKCLNCYSKFINKLPNDPNEIAQHISTLPLSELSHYSVDFLHQKHFCSENEFKVINKHEFTHLILQGSNRVENRKENSACQKLEKSMWEKTWNYHGKVFNSRIVTNISLLSLGIFGATYGYFSGSTMGIAAGVTVIASMFILDRYRIIDTFFETLHSSPESVYLTQENREILSLVSPAILEDLDTPLKDWVGHKEQEADERAASCATHEEIKAARHYFKNQFVNRIIGETINSRRIFRHIPFVSRFCPGQYPIITSLDEGKHFELFARLRFWNEQCEKLPAS